MFANALVLGAFVAVASAGSSALTFTNVPNPITDGKPQTLAFSANDTSSPVTILLRKGPARDLQTVQTITTSATNGKYIWTPCASLPNGDDYALEILQGTEMNYFGPFVVQGASGSEACPGVSLSASASSSGTTTSLVTAAHNATTAVATATGTASLGTSTALARNMTLSSATLSRTPISATVTPTNNGAGFQGTATSTPAHNGADSSRGVAGSSFALMLGAVAAVLLG